MSQFQRGEELCTPKSPPPKLTRISYYRQLQSQAQSPRGTFLLFTLPIIWTQSDQDQRPIAQLQPRRARHQQLSGTLKASLPLNEMTGGIKERTIYFSIDQENDVCHYRPIFGSLLLSDTDFVGASSTTHLAKRLNPSSTNLAWDVRPLYDDPSSLRRPVAGALPQLPPFEFAKRLFWVQYAYIGTIFSLINPREFEDRLGFVYHQPPDFSHRETCLVYCQALLVIAFGLMYSVNQWSGDDGPPGFKYFKHALRFLPDIHEEGSIFFVEVLCYVAYYMQNLNRRDAAFLYV